jgi:hypothetical protein
VFSVCGVREKNVSFVIQWRVPSPRILSWRRTDFVSTTSACSSVQVVIPSPFCRKCSCTSFFSYSREVLPAAIPGKQFLFVGSEQSGRQVPYRLCPARFYSGNKEFLFVTISLWVIVKRFLNVRCHPPVRQHVHTVGAQLIARGHIGDNICQKNKLLNNLFPNR